MKHKLIMIGIILMLLGITISLAGCVSESHHKYINIFITDAPFGKYWVHTYGHFILFSGYIDSNLVESYTIKYMDGNELKTIILSSADERLHIYLTDDNTSMYMDIFVNMTSMTGGESKPFGYMNVQPRNDGITSNTNDAWLYEYTFNLYIPRPEICEISNEVIE